MASRHPHEFPGKADAVADNIGGSGDRPEFPKTPERNLAEHVSGVSASEEALEPERALFNDKFAKCLLPGEGQYGEVGQEGGDGNGRKWKKKKSGEHPLAEHLPPSEETLQFVQRLNKLGLKGINAPALPDNSRAIEDFLSRYWDEGAFTRCKKVQHELQRGKLRDPHEYYNAVAEWKSYYAMGITPEILQVMSGYGDLKELLMDTRITDIGSANSNILRVLKAKRRELRRDDTTFGRIAADFEKLFGEKERISRSRAMDFLDRQKNKVSHTGDDYDLDLTAIDYTDAFPRLMRNNGRVNGVKADICSDPDELFSLKDDEGEPLLIPNGEDLLIHSLIYDRVEDFDAAMDNSRRMAKLDGSTRFTSAVIFPFTNVSDAMTRRGKPMKFWNKEGDPRESWIVKEDGEWTTEDCLRSLERIVFTLAQRGFTVKNIGVQPHVVCSPHSLITEAGVLRQEYEYLQKEADGVCKVPFYSEYSCQLLADVFQKAVVSGKGTTFAPQRTVADHERVGLPQEYMSYMLGGNIVEPIVFGSDDFEKVVA